MWFSLFRRYHVRWCQCHHSWYNKRSRSDSHYRCCYSTGFGLFCRQEIFLLNHVSPNPWLLAANLMTIYSECRIIFRNKKISLADSLVVYSDYSHIRPGEDLDNFGFPLFILIFIRHWCTRNELAGNEDSLQPTCFNKINFSSIQQCRWISISVINRLYGHRQNKDLRHLFPTHEQGSP